MLRFHTMQLALSLGCAIAFEGCWAAASPITQFHAQCDNQIDNANQCIVVADECGAGVAIAGANKSSYDVAIKRASTARCATQGASAPLDNYKAICVKNTCTAYMLGQSRLSQ